MNRIIAIVEDDPKEAQLLQSYFEHLPSDFLDTFEVRLFQTARSFLSTYQPIYDIVFMDINLPDLNGLEAAGYMRRLDQSVVLIFVTNMAQYAVRGDEVDALDFVVKPINYYRFSSMMAKALRSIAKRDEKEILVRSASKIARLPISQIYYVEVRDHLLIYHSTQGNLESWGKLSEIEKELAGYDFVRCSSSYLVNLRHIISVDGDTANIAGDRLPISQRRRKAFYNSVTEYLSGR